MVETMGKKQTGHISCVNKGGGVKRVSIWPKWWQIHSDICTTFIHPVVATTLLINPVEQNKVKVFTDQMITWNTKNCQ